MSEQHSWLNFGRGSVHDSSTQCSPQRHIHKNMIDASLTPFSAMSTLKNDKEFLMSFPFSQIPTGSNAYPTFTSFMECGSQTHNSGEFISSEGSQNSTPYSTSKKEMDVSSPNKRRRLKLPASKKKSKGNNKEKYIDMEEIEDKKGANKRWDPECSDFAKEFLVRTAQKGVKVDKTFKRPAFVACATAVNEKFNENYTLDNVANHLRTLKTKWANICFCKDISGAGWDEAKKMVVLSGTPYIEFVTAHSNLTCYVNEPVKLYESLRIVCGEDQATGSYRKAVYEQFGQSFDTSIPVIDVDNEIQLSTNSKKHAPDVDISVGTNSNGGPNKKSSTKASSQSTSRGANKRRSSKDVAMEPLIEKVGDMACLMVNAQKQKTSEKLSSAVYSLDDFDIDILDAAFDELYHNDDDCGKFIVKPNDARKLWMERFEKQKDASVQTPSEHDG